MMGYGYGLGLGAKILIGLGLIVALAGFLAYRDHQIASGSAAKVEVRHAAAAAQASADTVKRLKRSASVVAAENRKKDARIGKLTERLAKTKAETKPGDVCPAGCVLPGGAK